jgi:hypothetical protein
LAPRWCASCWRRASLIRYRWIPVLTASSTLWVLITLLSLVVGARRQAAMRRTRERWAREEREEEANEAWWLEPPAESAGAPPGPEVPKSDRDPEG